MAVYEKDYQLFKIQSPTWVAQIFAGHWIPRTTTPRPVLRSLVRASQAMQAVSPPPPPVFIVVGNLPPTPSSHDIQKQQEDLGRQRAAKLLEEYEKKRSAGPDWWDAGPGCCAGVRNMENGKLWAGSVASLVACQERCITFEACGAVEYGWTRSTANTGWCFVWSVENSCASLDISNDGCGQGGNNGVHAHIYMKSWWSWTNKRLTSTTMPEDDRGDALAT
eukprot:TRINITY_DN65694_c0_g1_i1.p1 TRINITY_DN65694_c0_g1~~TRINITY_DN65694_c0_g1_i1.p1  ORF type:complete len:221 (+),score=37.76 TRINITY_DN65694_c0_g1_i1:246-908(+)